MPIGLSAASYEGREYSGIVYGRGPIFVETLSINMKKDVFEQFLKDYYSTNKWGIVDTTSYKQEAEQHCQCDLTELFDEWVY
jgi:aminopeptidase N